MAIALDQDETVDPILLSKAQRFAALDVQIKTLKVEHAALKEDLSAAAAMQGIEESGGHRVLEFGRQIGPYEGFVRQRKSSRALDEQAAEDILRTRGLWAACTRVQTVIDEDAVMQALVTGDLTPEEVEQIFPETVTFAFVPMKAKK